MTKPQCSDCKHSYAIEKLYDPADICGLPHDAEPFAVIEYHECRRFPPIATFWGSTFPKALAVCGEFSKAAPSGCGEKG